MMDVETHRKPGAHRRRSQFIARSTRARQDQAVASRKQKRDDLLRTKRSPRCSNAVASLISGLSSGDAAVREYCCLCLGQAVSADASARAAAIAGLALRKLSINITSSATQELQRCAVWALSCCVCSTGNPWAAIIFPQQQQQQVRVTPEQARPAIVALSTLLAHACAVTGSSTGSSSCAPDAASRDLRVTHTTLAFACR
jgi:hypothetical protein